MYVCERERETRHELDRELQRRWFFSSGANSDRLQWEKGLYSKRRRLESCWFITAVVRLEMLRICEEVTVRKIYDSHRSLSHSAHPVYFLTHFQQHKY